MDERIVNFIGKDCVTIFLSDSPEDHIEPLSNMMQDLDLLSGADVLIASPYSAFSIIAAYNSPPEQIKLVKVESGAEKLSWWGKFGVVRWMGRYELKLVLIGVCGLCQCAWRDTLPLPLVLGLG